MENNEIISFSSENIYEVRIKGKKKFIRPYKVVVAFKCEMWTEGEKMYCRDSLFKTYATEDIKIIKVVEKY